VKRAIIVANTYCPENTWRADVYFDDGHFKFGVFMKKRKKELINIFKKTREFHGVKVKVVN
jgi:hypothetical protein